MCGFCNNTVYLIIKASNGFNDTKRDDLEKRMLENFIGHVFRTLS